MPGGIRCAILEPRRVASGVRAIADSWHMTLLASQALHPGRGSSSGENDGQRRVHAKSGSKNLFRSVTERAPGSFKEQTRTRWQ